MRRARNESARPCARGAGARHIGTIHAFCGDLLHERPIEAGIDPLFEVASEQEAQALADEAFDTWFEDCSRTRLRACVAYFDADQAEAPRVNSCEPRCRRFVTTATSRRRGGVRRLTEIAASMR